MLDYLPPLCWEAGGREREKEKREQERVESG